MSTKIITPEATLSYPAISAPKETPSGASKYSACLIFDDKPRELEAAVVATAVERWGAKAKGLLTSRQLRDPIRDGAEKPTVGYGAGRWFVNASSNRQPGVVSKYAGPDGKPLPITDPEELYPGCRVRASLVPFAYEVNGNRGVSFLLGNIQKLGDGPRLDGRLRPEDEFDALEDAPTAFDEEDQDDDPMGA
jgi:hypothetical protein